MEGIFGEKGNRHKILISKGIEKGWKVKGE